MGIEEGGNVNLEVCLLLVLGHHPSIIEGSQGGTPAVEAGAALLREALTHIQLSLLCSPGSLV